MFTIFSNNYPELLNWKRQKIFVFDSLNAETLGIVII